MATDKTKTTDAKTLRERAEALLREKPAVVPTMPTASVQSLVHELSVHQVELELQNQELRDAQIELAQSLDRFSDLYDFAPVGYVTLDEGGRILEANLTAATMLGVERQHLLGANLTRFVARQCQDDCYLHRRAVFAGDTKQVCELEMHQADGTPLGVRLESIAQTFGNDRHCRTALIDVTTLRQAWQKLEQSEKRYRRLAEAVTDYIYHVRVEQGRPAETVHEANCEAVTGYTTEEFEANSMLWITMVPPEDRAMVERQTTCVLTGQDAPPIEHRIQSKDGRLRWVMSTLSPQYDAGGSLIGYDALLRDVTRRKVAEEALHALNIDLGRSLTERSTELQQSINQVRLLGEAVARLGEGVLITENDTDWPGPRIVFANEAMCHISGYRPDELIGQSSRILQRDDTDRETLAQMKAELSAGRSCVVELINHRKDGTPYEAELFITPLVDAAGRRTNFVAIYRDVTERKQAERGVRDREQRLRALLNTASDSIITIDKHGIINSVNLATERMFGYTRDELVGQNVKILLPPPRCDEHDGYIARYLDTGEARIIGIGREVIGRRKDGTTLPIGLAVSEVEQLGLFTGILRDISERHKLQRDVLRIAEDEQRRIGQDLHDGTQQELAGLGMLAQTLLDQRTSESAAQPNANASSICPLAKRILDGIIRAHQEVQALSRGLVPVQLDREGLMDALRGLAFRTDALEGITCAFKCEQPVEIADTATATHLYRIAQEAVTNALKHGQPEHILIALESEDGNPMLQIADDGSGFQTIKNNEGLGLKIMHHRANLIGANLSVTPIEIGGTLVTCKVFLGGVDGDE